MPIELDPPTFRGIPCRGCYYTQLGCTVVDSLADNEPILTEREPHNPYDHNAIAVFNQDGVRFGYIGREYAAEIAPWMDQGVIFLAWKTGKIRCSTIVTLQPLRATPQALSNESKEPLLLNTDAPQEHEPAL